MNKLCALSGLLLLPILFNGMEPKKQKKRISIPFKTKKTYSIKKHPLYIDNLQLSTDVNKVDNQGNSPLIYAAQHNMLINLEIPPRILPQCTVT
jgi:hypothetical protein